MEGGGGTPLRKERRLGGSVSESNMTQRERERGGVPKYSLWDRFPVIASQNVSHTRKLA